MRDLYQGVRDGNWVQTGIGVVGLVTDVTSLGAGSVVKGAVKTVGKKVLKEVVEEGAEQVAKRQAKNALREQGKKQVAARRSEFKKVREEYWKREARENPDKYSEEDLERMREGKAPIRDGEPMHLNHKKPLSEGGSNCPDNLEPMTAKQHREHHKKQGDFSRWGKKGAEARRRR